MQFPPFRSRAARRRATRRDLTPAAPDRSPFEALETRRLLAAVPVPTAAINAGALEVNGTRKADEIHVDLNATSGQLDVTINGTPAGSFNVAEVTNAIRINSGGGNDTVVVGSTVTLPTVVRGGKGNDNLSGGGGADDLDGEAGKDTVAGGAGDDTVHGGAGNDTVSGDADDDSVRGDAGKDSVRGGDGNDDLDGGAGNDDCDGEAGDDRVTGERGRDRARGGLGDDTVDGGAGSDDVGGDDGNDRVRGDDGRDACDGGNGDDDLDGGRGRDRVRGGAGSDSFHDAFDDDRDRDAEIEDRGDDDGVVVTPTDLPAAVQSAFNAQFPGATIRQIERETEDAGVVYKIDFLNAQTQRQRAVYTEAGQLVEQEMRDAALTVGTGNHSHGLDDNGGDDNGADDGENVSVDQLPAAVRSAFDTQFPGVTIREVEREVEHGTTVFKIDFLNTQGQRFCARFTESGQFIQQEIHDGEDDNGGDGNDGGGSGGSGSGGGDNSGSGSGGSGDNSGSGGSGSGNSGSGSSGGGGSDDAPGDDHGGGGNGSDDGANHT